MLSLSESLPLRLALYQPDIPQNTGTLLRMGACLGIKIDIIEPCGFLLDDAALKRSAMDYADHVKFTRHLSWGHFFNTYKNSHRLLLLTTKAEQSHTDFTYAAGDILILGRESQGVPDEVHEAVHHRLTIPMQSYARSLNVAMAGSIVMSEAARQLGYFNFK